MRSLGPQAARVYDDIRAQILTGKLVEGTRLPSHEALSAHFQVALLTVRQAIARLQEEGLVTARQGRGTFVRSARTAPVTTEHSFRALVEASPLPMYSVDAAGTVRTWNAACERLLGRPAAEVLGRPLPFVPPEDEEEMRALLARVAGGEALDGLKGEVLRADGSRLWVQSSFSPLSDAEGYIVGVCCVMMDLSGQRREALHESEERFRLAFESASIGMVLAAISGELREVNGAFCGMTGYSRDELRGLPLRAITHPDDVEPSVERKEALLNGEVPHYQIEKRYLHRDGHEVWVLATNTLIRDGAGNPRYMIGQMQDITERREVEEQLRHQASHDLLTGLPNRLLLDDRIGQAMVLAERERQPLALIFLDLDRFKEINESLGHDFGDRLLQHIGPRLRGALRESDTIARMAGDEFAVLAPLTDEVNAILLVERILSALNQPFELQGHTLYVDASMGIALYPEHAGGPGDLMRHADVALHLAKRTGSEYTVYAPEQDEKSPTRLRLAADLREAIDRRQITLHYQPKINMRTGELVGVEALARWQHRDHGLIPPGEFVPLAEQTGLIKPLTLLVLDQAITQVRAWQDARRDLFVAVNLSARNLNDARLVQSLAGLMRAGGIDAFRLGVEITETAIMADPDRALDILTELHDLGLSIAVDDFGIGHSSLAYLKRLPADEIKIDRSFVCDLTTDEDDAFIVRSVVELGHHLGLTVTAEGVESRSALDVLAVLGCDLVQGYYLGPPMPLDALDRWMATYRPLGTLTP